MTIEQKKYHLIKSGNNLRREYFWLNKSPLFLNIPDVDTSQEQKKSYFNFLNNKFVELLNFYFPVEYEDHNNNIKIAVERFRVQEPDITIKEASYNFLTWSYKIYLNWKFDWTCKGINVDWTTSNTENLEQEQIILISLKEWAERSFKIGEFKIEKRSTNIDEWNISEEKGKIVIDIDIKEKKDDGLFITFEYKEEREILLCRLPKMDDQGTFIINGHRKVTVCQSVRSPSIYCFFNKEQSKFFAEIIPSKGSWINILYNSLLKRLEIKFLNSKKVIGIRNLLEEFGVSDNDIEMLLLNSGDKNNLEKKKEPINKNDIPKFLFVEKNSYFDFGILGRKKFNDKILLKNRIINQILADDIKNSNGEIVFKKGDYLDEEKTFKLERLFLNENVNKLDLPISTNSLNWVTIRSVKYPEETVNVIGIVERLEESKIYFDLSDLFCVISYYLNVFHGIVPTDLEENKDNLENQIIRCIGDLLYSMFDSKLGGFLYQDMSQKYLANISQMKKTDLAKMPNLREFDVMLKNFFNTSPLVQLQNQNNPSSEISYARKVSVLGFGGFSANNITLNVRNVHISHYGRYGLMSTPEGKHFGLSHSMALGASINKYNQITAPYRPVKNCVVLDEIIHLSSEEEHEHYISHCNIRIDEKNNILDKELLVKHKKRVLWVNSNLVDFIDSSFYFLTSVEESLGPFIPYNDATRALMTSNMQRGAISPIKNQVPLIATGSESILRKNSMFSLYSDVEGVVSFSDNRKIMIKTVENDIKEYNLEHSISNKYIFNFSTAIVKKGDFVKKGQIIADGYYTKDGELSLGYNLRVAYISHPVNFEDAMAVNQDLVKKDIFTYITAKEYSIIRYNTPSGPEIFSNLDMITNKTKFSYIDDEGIVKIGTVVNENDVLVRKLTPQADRQQDAEEEALLFKLLGGRGQKYIDSSLYLPKGESSRGVVYDIIREEKTTKDELEIVKIKVAYERKLEDGDKMTARYGNKGIIKLVPAADMPFDEDGPFDIIINELGVSPRMNMGQLLEVVLAESVYRLNTKLLIRPFNSISLDDVKELATEAGIEDMGNKVIWDGITGNKFKNKVYTGRIYMMLLNHKAIDKIHARSIGAYSLIFQQPLKGRKRDGGQRSGEMEGWVHFAHGAAKTLLRIHSSDDIKKRNDLQNFLLFGKKRFNLLYNKSESFNLVIQYLRGIGFDLEATDFFDRKIDFYKFFSS